MEPIRAVTWNVEMSSWDDSKKETAKQTFAIFKEANPPVDLICLQEAEKVEPFHEWLGRGYGCVKTGEKTALFFNTQRFQALNGGECPLMGDFTAITLMDNRSHKRINVISSLFESAQVLAGEGVWVNKDAWYHLFQIAQMPADIALIGYSVKPGAKEKAVARAFTRQSYSTDRTHISSTFWPQLCEVCVEAVESEKASSKNEPKNVSFSLPEDHLDREKARRYDKIYVKGEGCQITTNIQNLSRTLSSCPFWEVSRHEPVIGVFGFQEIKNKVDGREPDSSGRRGFLSTFFSLLVPPTAPDGGAAVGPPVVSACAIM